MHKNGYFSTVLNLGHLCTHFNFFLVAGEDYEELSDGRKVDVKMVPKLENEIPAISEKSLASTLSEKVFPIWAANQVLYKTEPPPP